VAKPVLTWEIENSVAEISVREMEWDETVLQDVDRQVCALLVKRGRTMALFSKTSSENHKKLPEVYAK
jgi:hypothetical protein